MVKKHQSTLIIVISSFIVLMHLIIQGSPPIKTVEQWTLAILFGGLLLLVNLFGIMQGNIVISLLPLTAVSGYLMLGKLTISWLLWFILLFHGLLRHGQTMVQQKAVSWPTHSLIQLTLLNMSIHVLSLEIGGILYENGGGELPLNSLTVEHIIPLLLLSVGYVATNHITFILSQQLHQVGLPKEYLQQISMLLVYELAPLTFASLFSLIYAQGEIASFILLLIAYIFIVLVCHRLSILNKSLHRRINELDLLHSLGQSLGGTLSLAIIGQRLYGRLSSIVPIDTFVLAIVDAETKSMLYSTVIEDNQLVEKPSDLIHELLLEYSLQQQRPLLLNKATAKSIASLHLPSKPSIKGNWISIPILKGQTAHGALTIHTADEQSLFTENHSTLLETIANQVSMSVENALLFNKTDEQLNLRVQELNSILATTTDGILLLGAHTNIITSNQAFENFVAPHTISSESAMLLREETLLNRLGFSHQSWLRACSQAEIEGGQIKEKIEIQETIAERTLMTVKDQTGAIKGWLIVLRDIGEEIALQQLREDMIHMLVHDLRSPLNAITLGISASQRQIATHQFEEIGRFLQHANNGTNQMMTLINQLLDIYQMESKQVRLERQTFSVSELFSATKSHFFSQLEETNISCQVDVQKEAAFLFADRDCINRVINNLVDNSIKFTLDNGRIRLFAHPHPEDSSFTILGVQDSGNGIDPNIQANLFKKFIRGDNSNSRRRGSGLGLAYCRLVVETHGGTIWVESSGLSGEGATFYLSLPAIQMSETVPSS